MRIVGGTFRGRKLRYHGDPRTRPMKHRVREAIFNLLGPSVKGKYAIDLFAGTGAIGLEAISRGAQGAIFLERHFPTARLIETNADSLDCRGRCQVHAADTFIWIAQHASELPHQSWAVFCSPPYDLFTDRHADLVQLVQTLYEAAPESTRFIIESDERFEPPLSLPFAAWDVREYPPARVAIAEKPVAD